MDISFESEILHRLQQMSPAARHAFVIHEDKVYFARDRGAGPTFGCRPSSPAVKLLQGLFEQHRDLSFFILRKRIYLSYEAGEMDRGFIDLVAKRFSRIEASEEVVTDMASYQFVELGDLKTEFLPLQDRKQDLRFTRSKLKGFDEVLEALTELEAQVVRGEVLHDVARPIGAILTDSEGKVLGSSVHAGAINKTLHAEIILLQNLFIQGFERDSEQNYRLYVSMTPCRMCAGAWWEVFGESLQVYFRDMDPGTKARLTVFERQSRQQQIQRV